MASQPQLHDRRHKGWFWIENNVLDIHGPALGATGIAVYALLARHVGSDGKAFPSLHRFEVLLGLSRNTAKKYLKLLASPEIGLIRIVERTTPNGDADSHIYELLTVKGGSTIDLPGSTIDLPGSTIDLPGSTIDLRVGQPLTGGRSTIDPEGNYLKETHLKEEDLNQKTDLSPPKSPQMGDSFCVQTPEGEKSIAEVKTEAKAAKAAKKLRTSPGIDYTPGFLAWWDAYPADRRLSKRDCFTVWQREQLEQRAAELVEKLERLKGTTWKHVEPKYVKTSLPYLNSGRYDDDLVPFPDIPTQQDSGLSPSEYRTAMASLKVMEELANDDRRQQTRLLQGA